MGEWMIAVIIRIAFSRGLKLLTQLALCVKNSRKGYFEVGGDSRGGCQQVGPAMSNVHMKARVIEKAEIEGG
jgi:hypothetical protein